MTGKNFYALFGQPTLENLDANQRGMLTLEQQSALEKAANNQRLTTMFWGILILAVVGYVSFFLWQVSGLDNLLSTTSIITIGLVAFGVVLLTLILSGGDFFFILSRDDIENGQVESVIGKVIWTGRRYRMVSDSRKLQSLRYGRVLPPPGEYRFYCLPDSGLVVLAEELGLISTSQPNDLLLDALARANHFSMEDLQINREGLLSKGQGIRLLGDALWLVFLSLILIGIVVIAQSHILNENLMVFGLFAAIGLLLLVRPGWGSINVVWDIWRGKVEYMDGRVTRYARRTRNGNYYTYQLKGMKFTVSRFAYNALIEGVNYRVYFVPHGKRLVAIEPLD